MAKTLKHANKGEIVFLSKGNYDHLYSSILKILGKNAPFAPVKITSTSVIWENNTKTDFKSIIDAPTDVRGQLLLLFEQESLLWAQKLKSHDLEYVLTIPDSSYIFYAVDQSNDDNVLNNKYKFIITGWACKFNKSLNSGTDGFEKDIIEAKERHQNVIVEMIDANNIPISNGVFEYNFNNSIIKEITTDAHGLYHQGICLVGSVYKFKYLLTGQKREFKVEKNIETYKLKFSPTFNVHISVVDQFNNPATSLPTEIRYGNFHCYKMSDGFGKININDLLYEDPSLRLDIKPEGFPNQDFAVDCPDTIITIVVSIKPPIKPYLLVLENGKPVNGITVKFLGSIQGAFSTDPEGKFFLPQLLPGQEFNALISRGEQHINKAFTIVEDQEEYILELPEIPIVQEPEDEDKDPEDNSDDENNNDLEEPAKNPFDCYIIVKAKEDDTPLSNYTLKLESDTITGLYVTDINGKIPLGKQTPGNTINAYSGESPLDIHIIVIEEGKVEYVIYVDKPIVVIDEPEHEIPQDCHIKVLSKITGLPVPNFALEIDSDRMKGHYSTDENGIVPLQNMTVGVDVHVIPGSHNPVSFRIEQYREEYIIQVDDSQAVIGDILITQCEHDKKTPIPYIPITLTNKKGEKITKTTDSSGNIVVPRNFFTNDEKVRVHLDIPNRIIRDFHFKFNSDCDHYLLFLINPSNWKKLLYLLIPLLLFLLCLIRCERDITLQTVDINDKPIPECNVSLQYTEHAFWKEHEIFIRKKQEHFGVTNNEGEYTFEKMPCSVFSYVFYSFHKAYAYAISPNKVIGDTTFVFHWNKHVKIILDENSIPNFTPGASGIGQPILSPCDAGASGRNNVAANTVSDPMTYNMGVDKGTFSITYETGDACPDQIDIYNHKPGQNWQTGKHIFSSGMVTTPTEEITRDVNFSDGSMVTVIVTTGPNDGSLWNYQLSCPH